MKCPNCTTDFHGKPTPRSESEPDMVRNLKGEDGKLYQKCNHCGFRVLEPSQPTVAEPVSPSTKETQGLRKENAAIRAKAADMETKLKDALRQLAESQKPVMEEEPVPPPPVAGPAPLTEVPPAAIAGPPKA